MSAHSLYETLRQFADSWGLLAMVVVFAGCAAWPFRPSARSENDKAANMIFEDDTHG